MIRFKQLAAGAAAMVCLASTLTAQIDEVAKQALLDSAEAIKELDSVSYQAKKFGTGPLAGLIDVSGEVRVSRPGKVMPGQTTYVDGRIVLRGQPDKLFRVSWDGRMATWCDFDEQTVIERPITDRRGAKQNVDLAKQLVVSEISDLNPFVKTIDNSEMISMKGTEELNGVVCNVVEAGASGGARKTVWHIGVADRLPRRMAMVTGDGENAVSLVLELQEVVVNDAMKAEDFAIETPPGFRVVKVEKKQPVVPAPAKVNMGIANGRQLPNFQLRSDSGDKSAEDYRGTTLVMCFWGSKFAKSLDCMKMLKAQREFFEGEAISFVAVACREDSADTPRSWMQAQNNGLELLYDGETVMSQLQVTGCPSVYVVTPTGAVQEFFVGCPTEEALLEAITAAASAGKR